MPTAKELMQALLNGKTIKDKTNSHCTYRLDSASGKLIDEDGDLCDIDFDDDDLYISGDPCRHCGGDHTPHGYLSNFKETIRLMAERTGCAKETDKKLYSFRKIIDEATPSLGHRKKFISVSFKARGDVSHFLMPMDSNVVHIFFTNGQYKAVSLVDQMLYRDDWYLID